ncbi:MAG TPA: hypothetical protein VGM20_02860 [Gemmatimonadales bacterium]
MRLVNVAAPIGMVMALGCSNTPTRDAKPLTPRPRRDGEVLDVSNMMATVRNATSARPNCPVNPHVEASLVVQGISGTIQYHWERSDSTSGPLRQLVVDSAAAAKMQHLALTPDDWTDTKSGVQLRLQETVHVTYPFDFRSPSININATCY